MMSLSFRKKALLVALSVIFPIVFVVGCGRRAERDDEALTVVATIYPLYDLAREVGGEYIQAICLLPPGASPHTYHPTPQDIMVLEQAELVLCIGEGVDGWLTPMLSADEDTQIITMMELVELLPAVDYSWSFEEEGGEHDQDHQHGTCDPHVWMDPLNMKVMVRYVAVELSKLDGEHTEDYRRTADDYIARLEDLDEEYERATAGFSRKSFVAFHSSLTYLAERYGWEQAAVIEVAPGVDPDPRYLAGLIDFIKESDVACVLAEPQFNPQLAKTVSSESGVPLVTVDPIGDPNHPDRDTYIENMQANLEVFKDAFGEKRD